jgi:DNA repair exonuclease SbcCD ATPase subunit
MNWIYAIALISSHGLEATALYLWFRGRIAHINKAVAEAKKTLAERDKIIEETRSIADQRLRAIEEKEKLLAEKDKTIAEKEQIIAQTRILELEHERSKLELQAAQFKIQDQLDAENKNYKEAQDKFADIINDLTRKIEVTDDASTERDAAMKALTDVIDNFSKLSSGQRPAIWHQAIPN